MILFHDLADLDCQEFCVVDAFSADHFLLSADRMRIISLPHSLNGASGLVGVSVGDRKTLERLSIDEIIKLANPYSHELFDRSALDLYNAHPEP